MVLTIVVLFCVAVTVPPLVAVNAGASPVARASPPLKLIVEPVLALSRMPVPVSLIAPLKLTVPAVRFWTSIDRLPVLVMAAPMLTVPVPPAISTSAPAVTPVMDPPVTVTVPPTAESCRPVAPPVIATAFSVSVPVRLLATIAGEAAAVDRE